MNAATVASSEEGANQFPIFRSAVGNPMLSVDVGTRGGAASALVLDGPVRGTKRKAEHRSENRSLGSGAFAEADRLEEQLSENRIVEEKGLDDLAELSRDDYSEWMSATSPLLCSPSPSQAIVHVSQSGLWDLQRKLTQGQRIGRGDVDKILRRRQSLTVPLDIRDAGSPFLDLPSPTDLDDACEKLGAHDLAEGLVKALDYVSGPEAEDL